jgi:dipeptidyl aminopeptidase/acylaminoacyl peptidase
MVDADFEVLTLSDTNAGHTSDGGGSGLLSWSPDGKFLYVSLGWRGEVQLAKIDAETGEMTVLTQGRHCCVAGGSTLDRKWFSGYVGDPIRLNEVCLIDGESGEVRVLTQFNHWVNQEVELSSPEEVEIETTDGLTVHAWVMSPIGWKGKKEQPAVLEIHGGPHAQYGWAFFHEFQVLASQGYWVVFSNPRGSKGYGQAWCEAIQSNWGEKDWQDIEAVAQWMTKHPGMDCKRLGVMGGSYGGWMTNWVIGHTAMFRAAITDRCVSNMVSFAGNSDFPMNDGEYFGGVAFGSLERIAPLWRQSPLAYFEGVTTPTLIIHSEGDLRCNIEQSEQVFCALQSQGVESRFVRYPVSTSHGMSRGGPPDLRIHRLTEITKWWKKHLG